MLLLYSARKNSEGALLAQPVEHAAVNRGVVSSSLSQGAIIFLASWRSGLTHMPFTHALHGFESRTGHQTMCRLSSIGRATDL